MRAVIQLTSSAGDLTFDHAAKKITFTGYTASGIKLDRILTIYNVNVGVNMYNFGNPAMGGSVGGASNNELTLEFDTTGGGFTDADLLFVLYDDPNYQVLGRIDGAAVTTDANGTIQQYLRGLVTKFTVAIGIDLQKIAGTVISVNSGNKDAGTQRVVLATDQPQLTNPLKVDGSAVVQPISSTDLGTVTDAMTVGNVNGSGISKLRNLSYLWNLVIDTVNSWLNTNIFKINGVTPLMGAGNTGTGSLRVTLATDQATLTNPLHVDGSVAHDAVNSGNPDLIGYEAVTLGNNVTPVAAGDRSKGYCDRHGIPRTMAGHPKTQTFRSRFTAAQTNVALVSISSGQKMVLTSVYAKCSNGNTVAVSYDVGFGASTTPTGAGNVLSDGGCANGSGFSRGTGAGVIGQGADDEDLRVTCSAPTSGDITFGGTYYIIEG